MALKKCSCAVFVFVFLVSLSTVVGAQQPGQRRIVRRTILDYKDVLALRPDQVKKIRGYLEEFEKEARPLKERIVSLNREIIQLLKDKGDIKTLRKKVKENYSLRADLFVDNIATERKIEGVLTPQQLKKWKEIKRNRGRVSK